MSVNKVILVGHLGADPEIRQVGEQSVASFSLATTETWKDATSGERKSSTTWVRVSAWRGLAKLAKDYMKKGSQIYVEGKLKENSYTDKEGIKRNTFEVQAEEIRLLDKRENSGNSNYSNSNSEDSTSAKEGDSTGYSNFSPSDDDLPF